MVRFQSILHFTDNFIAVNLTLATLHLQQRVFNRFRTTYNKLRPHEALDDDTPASRLFFAGGVRTEVVAAARSHPRAW
ncbi:MAG: hypothetical protein C4311_14705 [Chloroflexota bacterium]